MPRLTVVLAGCLLVAGLLMLSTDSTAAIRPIESVGRLSVSRRSIMPIASIAKLSGVPMAHLDRDCYEVSASATVPLHSIAFFPLGGSM